MDSASVGFSLILRASSFSNSYDAVLAVIYLGILSIVFFPPLRGGLGWGCFPPLRGEELRSIERPVDGRRTLPGWVFYLSPPPEGRSGGVFIFLPTLNLALRLRGFLSTSSAHAVRPFSMISNGVRILP